ncbi:O-antigen ligase family protein [Virgibacillus siamensis]|uniref:O-antigen ligase family protein n=1 Tax=Virgibacillus siamensis TaxID=480071 RepID=UPI000986722E|nr:O-antigen ligase family protein [Virgibacillus siamensis]
MAYQKYGIYLLLIYFPVRTLLIELAPVLRFLGDVIIVGMFLHILLQDPVGLLKKYKFTWFFLLFVAVGVVVGLLQGVALMAVIIQVRTFLIPFLLIYIVGEMRMGQEFQQHFVSVSFVMGVLVALHGLIAKISHRTWLMPDSWQAWDLAAINSGRIYGTLGNPNILATYLCIVFFLVVFFRKRFTWHTYAGLIVIAGTVVLTYSRGTLLAFVIGLVVMSFLWRNWKIVWRTVFAFLVAVALIYFPAKAVAELTSDGLEEPVDEVTETGSISSSLFVKRFLEMFSGETIEKSAGSGRIYIVLKGLEIFLDQPLVGTGFGTYGDTASLFYKSPIYEKYNVLDGLYTDNQYVQILVETGIVGAFLVLLFFWRTIRSGNNFYFFLLIAGTIAGFFYNILEDKTFVLYLFVFLGLEVRRWHE